MAEGRVVNWFPDRGGGYGFISPDAGGNDIFMHTGDVMDKRQLSSLAPDTRVSYDLAESDRGPKAARIRVLEYTTQARVVLEGSPPAAEPDGDYSDVVPEADFRSELERLAKGMVDGLIEVARGHNWLE